MEIIELNYENLIRIVITTIFNCENLIATIKVVTFNYENLIIQHFSS